MSPGCPEGPGTARRAAPWCPEAPLPAEKHRAYLQATAFSPCPTEVRSMPDDALHSPKARPYRADAERSYVLPPNYYIDPAVYEREKREIFYKAWNYAGHVSQLANVGDYVTCRVADQELFVIRSKDERLRAFYNVCAASRPSAVEGLRQRPGHHLPLSRLVVPCRRAAAHGAGHGACGGVQSRRFPSEGSGRRDAGGFRLRQSGSGCAQPEEPDRRPGSGDAALPAGTAESEVLAPADATT